MENRLIKILITSIRTPGKHVQQILHVGPGRLMRPIARTASGDPLPAARRWRRQRPRQALPHRREPADAAPRQPDFMSPARSTTALSGPPAGRRGPRRYAPSREAAADRMVRLMIQEVALVYREQRIVVGKPPPPVL